MHRTAVLSPFVLGLQILDSLLHPAQQLAQLLSGVGPQLCRIGGHLRSVHRLHRQINQLQGHSRPHRALEQLPHALAVSLVESPQGVVVGMLPPG